MRCCSATCSHQMSMWTNVLKKYFTQRRGTDSDSHHRNHHSALCHTDVNAWVCTWASKRSLLCELTMNARYCGSPEKMRKLLVLDHTFFFLKMGNTIFCFTFRCQCERPLNWHKKRETILKQATILLMSVSEVDLKPCIWLMKAQHCHSAVRVEPFIARESCHFRATGPNHRLSWWLLFEFMSPTKVAALKPVVRRNQIITYSPQEKRQDFAGIAFPAGTACRSSQWKTLVIESA